MISSLPGKASRTLFGIARLAEIYRILGKSILISCLPGKASRKIVVLQGLRSDSTCFLIEEPGKLDIKRCESDILFISLLFKIEIMTLFDSHSSRLKNFMSVKM